MNIITLTTTRGEVLVRPTSEGDAPAYRDLRLAALRAHPEAFGADYESLAARPIEHWQERMRAGAGGDHGVTYVAEAQGELIGIGPISSASMCNQPGAAQASRTG